MRLLPLFLIIALCRPAAAAGPVQPASSPTPEQVAAQAPTTTPSANGNEVVHVGPDGLPLPKATSGILGGLGASIGNGADVESGVGADRPQQQPPVAAMGANTGEAFAYFLNANPSVLSHQQLGVNGMMMAEMRTPDFLQALLRANELRMPDAPGGVRPAQTQTAQDAPLNYSGISPSIGGGAQAGQPAGLTPEGAPPNWQAAIQSASNIPLSPALQMPQISARYADPIAPPSDPARSADPASVGGSLSGGFERTPELTIPQASLVAAFDANPNSGAANYVAAYQNAAAGNYEQAYRHSQTFMDSEGEKAGTKAVGLHAIAAYETGRFAEANATAKRVLDSGAKSPLIDSIYRLSKDKVDSAKTPEPPEESEAPEGNLDITLEGSSTAELTPQAKLKAREYARRTTHNLSVGDYKKAAEDAEIVQALAPSPRAYNMGAYAKLRAERLDGALQDSAQAYAMAQTQVQTIFKNMAFRKLAPSQQAVYQDLSKEMVMARRIESAVHGKRSAWREMLGSLADGAAVEERAHLKPSLKRFFQSAQRMFEEQRMDLMAALAEELITAPAAAPAPRRQRVTPFSLVLASLALIALAALWIAILTRKQRAFPERMRSALLDEAAGEGAPVEKFRILRSAGRGGMGAVYVAEDLQRGRIVALKTLREELRSNPKQRERFLTEARIVAKLEHPNIVAIHDVLATEAGITLVFEFIEGETLSARLKDKPLTLEAARGILLPVCSAVDFAHSKKIIHQDLKPANIMIAPSGHVKVMDFGLARQVQSALSLSTRTKEAAGTPAYMSPELEEGMISPAADVFALGVTLYEMLAGEPPFTGTPAGVMLQKREGKFTPLSKRLPGLPAELDALIARALAPQADLRQESAKAFAAELNSLPFRSKVS